MLKWKRLWLSLPAWLRNKYFLAGFGFLIWMSFLDTNSLITQFELSREINELEDAKLHYEQQLTDDLESLKQLAGSDESLEKFARETYRMTMEGEDVYLIDVNSLDLE